MNQYMFVPILAAGDEGRAAGVCGGQHDIHFAHRRCHQCFLLYTGMAAAAFVFVYTRLPYTRGQSVEDMEVLFAN